MTTLYLVEQNNLGMEKEFTQYLTEAVILARSVNEAKAAAVDVCAAFGWHIQVSKLTVTELGQFTGTLRDSQFRWTSSYGKVLAISQGGEA